jgi:hypothetical protein
MDPKTTTDEGIKIDLNSFRTNANASIPSNREFLSNVTDSSDLQELKHEDLTTITDDGTTIERNLLTERGDVSICPSFDPCSNTIH